MSYKPQGFKTGGHYSDGCPCGCSCSTCFRSYQAQGKDAEEAVLDPYNPDCADVALAEWIWMGNDYPDAYLNWPAEKRKEWRIKNNVPPWSEQQERNEGQLVLANVNYKS